MKIVDLDSREITLDQVLQEAADGEVVFQTADGETRFALVSADESDREVFSLGSNPEFLAYLDGCRERAMAGPRKSLRELRESHEDDPSRSRPAGETN